MFTMREIQMMSISGVNDGLSWHHQKYMNIEYSEE